GLDVGHGAPAHLLVHGADDPPLNFLVEALAKDSECLWRSNDREGLEIAAENAILQFFGCVLDPPIFFLLVEVRLLVCRVAIASALVNPPGSIGLDVAILPILALLMGFGSQIDLILVSLVAEEEHLAAVSDQNQRIVGKGHRK